MISFIKYLITLIKAHSAKNIYEQQKMSVFHFFYITLNKCHFYPVRGFIPQETVFLILIRTSLFSTIVFLKNNTLRQNRDFEHIGVSVQKCKHFEKSLL